MAPTTAQTGRRTLWRRVLGGTALAATGLLAAYAAYLSMVLTLPGGQDRPPLLLYGSPYPLRPGLDVAFAHLPERLERLGYREVSREVRTPGEFRVAPDAVDVYLRSDPDRYVQASPVRLALDQGRVARVLTLPAAEPALPVHLEPPLLSGVRGASRQVRRWLPLAEVPSVLVRAVLAIEDRRFYRHLGVDPVGILRALWVNLRRGEIVQGGSTITQQLAKTLFYSRERTPMRKLREAAAALVLEQKYGKAAILESYLNEIYLGQAGSVALYGVGEAARWYFGKPVQAVTAAEAALLAGLIRGPNLYTPLKDLDLARARRDLVLARLRDDGALTPEVYAAARAEPIVLAQTPEATPDAPYFVDYVLHLPQTTGDAFPPGAKIVTTLDPIVQRIAEEALQQGLARLERAHPTLRRTPSLQGALVALDPRTGGVLAMVGGREYRASQFNRAVQARRQPGSLFKPFVFLAAFEAEPDRSGPLTAASLIPDEPVSFPAGPSTWSPQNADRRYRGPVTVRAALEESLNVPTVRVAHTIGIQRVKDLARRLGVESPLDANLSLALGTSEVSLLEITAAYGALANGGRYFSPSPIQAVIAGDGETPWFEPPERRQAVSAASAYLITSLLKGVIARGTAAGIASIGLPAVVAGKTGTTDGFRDAWFVGYTPELVIGVWVGFDDGSALGLPGAGAALPIWADFARRVLSADAPDFTVPPDVVTRKIDPHSGQLATANCPEVVEEVFREGTEPTEYCALHGEGVWGRVKRFFGL